MDINTLAALFIISFLTACHLVWHLRKHRKLYNDLLDRYAVLQRDYNQAATARSQALVLEQRNKTLYDELQAAHKELEGAQSLIRELQNELIKKEFLTDERG
jgi:outer membrane lipopolysaccharide assembly protein LptE/RlpB